MEENNNEQNNNSEKHHYKEFISMLVAAFLGGFLAMYFVADQIFDKHHQPRAYAYDSFERQMQKDFEKMYEHDRKAFDREFRNLDREIEQSFNQFDKETKNDWKQFKLSDNWFNNKKVNKTKKSDFNPLLLPDMTMDSVKIKTQFDDDEYKVIIGLKPFNGDDSKINYNVSGRKLTVFGSSKIQDKNYEQDISFSQDFLLPQNADISKIKKEKEGNELIIEVPIK